MSASIVEDVTINRILAFLLSSKGQHMTPYYSHSPGHFGVETQKEAEALGKALFAMNVAAIEQRYGVGEAPKFRPLDYVYLITPCDSLIKVLKSAECLQYQCAEGIVPKTKLFKELGKFCNDLSAKIVHALPDWEDASWG